MAGLTIESFALTELTPYKGNPVLEAFQANKSAQVQNYDQPLVQQVQTAEQNIKEQSSNIEDQLFKNFSAEERAIFEKEVVDQVNIYQKSGSLRAERVLDWEETTTRIILERDVPTKDYQFWKEFTSAVVYVESEGKHSAQSEAGALGLTQLTPSTAEMAAKRHGIYNFDLKNGWTALRLGRFYLGDLMERFGADISVLAYYAGENFAKQKVVSCLKNKGVDTNNRSDEQIKAYIDQYQVNIANLGSLDGKEYLIKVVTALRILEQAREAIPQTRG